MRLSKLPSRVVLAMPLALGVVDCVYADCVAWRLLVEPDVQQRAGVSVSVDADTALVGIIGDPALAGGCAVFRRTDAGWTRESIFRAPAVGPVSFGYPAIIKGYTAVLGAITWVNLTTIDGAVFVYERSDDGTWSEGTLVTATMADPDPDRAEFFGGGIALDGDTLVVGAYNLSVAFAFERQLDGQWMQTQQLLPNDGRGYFYGRSIALSGDLAVIGAPQDFHVGSWAGSAYVLRRTEKGEWVTTQKLLPSPPSFIGNFGFSVAIDDQQNLLVGEYNGATDGESSGIVHVYSPTKNGSFEYRQRIVCPSHERSANFGYSIAVDGDLLIAGADHWNGPMFGNGGAFIFQRQPDGMYRQTGLLMAPDGQDGDWFGNQVAISGDTAIVGALFRDEAGFEDAGGAYAFHISRDDDGDGAMDDCQCDLDTNFDGLVNVTDLAFTISNIGRSGPEVGRTYGDFDNDRDTDLTDLAMLLAGFGSACEP
ncbi:MAG: hypothetical protein ACKVS9_12330 [Phycisphaerae bacterium]